MKGQLCDLLWQFILILFVHFGIIFTLFLT